MKYQFLFILLSIASFLFAANNNEKAIHFPFNATVYRDSILDDSMPVTVIDTITHYGVLTIKADRNTQLTAANNLLTDYVRDAILLSRWDGSKSMDVDFWKQHNKKILLNINNDSTPSAFPLDTVAFKTKLNSVLDVYGSSAEVVVIENEELNKYDSTTVQNGLYHFGSMQDYINELTAAVTVCTERGVPVTNGGLTTPLITSLKHYYDVSGKTDSTKWLIQQTGGVSTDSTRWKRTDSLLAAYKNLPLAFVNLHWYEPLKITTRLSGILQVLCNYITQQTGKKVITNETGLKTTDSSFVTMLMKQWDSINVKYCIFFDGIGSAGAKPLTSTSGTLLSSGIAYRNYNFGTAASCQQPINITPSGFINICQGTSVTVTALDSLSNYLWNTGDTTQSITVNTTGNYSVTSYSGNCIAFSSAVAAVMVNPLPARPVITTNISPSNVCSGSTIKLTSSSATKYLWSTGDTTKTITVSTAGNYAVIITDANGCKNTSDTTVVTYVTPVKPTVTPDISLSNLCPATIVNLTSSFAPKYSWNTGDSTQSIAVTTGGKYTVTTTDSNGCKSKSDTTSITYLKVANPTITTNVSPNNLCPGNTVKLTSSFAQKYLWSTGDTTKSITVSTAGNYTVTITNSYGCKSTSDPTTVTYLSPAKPTISSDVSPANLCPGIIVNLTSSPAKSYLWSTADTTQGIVVNKGGIYSVTITDTNGCKTTSDITAVTYVSPVKPTISSDVSPNNLCPGATVNLTSSPAANYVWNRGDTTQSILANTAGNYSVTITDSNGCKTASDPTAVTYSIPVKPTITTDISPNNVCVGNTVKLTASASNAYLWSTSATTQSIVVSTAGIYTVTVTNTYGCVSTSDTTTVTYALPPVKPIITTNISPNNICPSTTVNLTSSSAKSYLWSTAETIQSIVAKKSGNYTVTTTDINGCKSTSDITAVTYKTCNAPTNLNVTNIASNSATIRWDSVTCSVGYQYQYGKKNNKGVIIWTTAQINNGKTTSQSLTNLSSSTTYYWQVLTRCKAAPDEVLSVYASGPSFTTLKNRNGQRTANAESGKLNVTIEPNPVHDFLHIKNLNAEENTSIIVISAEGKMMRKINVRAASYSLDVTELGKGVYYLRVDNRQTFGFVKE